MTHFRNINKYFTALKFISRSVSAGIFRVSLSSACAREILPISGVKEKRNTNVGRTFVVRYVRNCHA